MFMSKSETFTAAPVTASLNSCDRAILKNGLPKDIERMQEQYKDTHSKRCKYLSLYIVVGVESEVEVTASSARDSNSRQAIGGGSMKNALTCLRIGNIYT